MITEGSSEDKCQLCILHSKHIQASPLPADDLCGQVRECILHTSKLRGMRTVALPRTSSLTLPWNDVVVCPPRYSVDLITPARREGVFSATTCAPNVTKHDQPDRSSQSMAASVAV
jgi:hypothetical protein